MWRTGARCGPRGLASTLLLSLTFALNVAADTDNPYTGIVDRNVFQLRPPVLVPPPTNMPAPPPPASKLTLTGITTIFGKTRALFTAQGTGKPQEAGKQEFYSLAVGQRADGIEVLSIDPKKGVVRLRNNGVEETLDFINNGARAVASAGQPGLPGAQVAAAGAPGRGAAVRQIPTSTPNVSNPASVARNAGYPSTGSLTGGGGVYGGTVGNYQGGTLVGTPTARQPFRNPHMPEIDPATQAIMIELERERTREAVTRGEMPPLPPTPLMPQQESEAPAPPVPPSPF